MNIKTKIKTGIAVLAGVLLVGTAPAFAGRFTDQVRYQLVQAAIALGLGDFELTHEPVVDTLYDGQTDYISLTLRRGVQYSIVGACDEDCRDIDLSFYDGNGVLPYLLCQIISFECLQPMRMQF